MFIGIDVAKDRLDVHIRPAGETFSVARNSEDIEGSGETASREINLGRA